MCFSIRLNGYDDFLQHFVCTQLGATILLPCSDIWAMKKLPLSFYLEPDVNVVARKLLGKLVVTRFEGKETIARIVETEAYNGIVDKASHAYGSRRTARTAVMYAAGGVAYVYLCYGMHHLFNIVTNVVDVPHAVLVRALEPLSGMDYMLERRGLTEMNYSITRGPGSAAQAMGIHTGHSGLTLLGHDFFLAQDEYIIESTSIIATPRIGVDYAAEDALLPNRFFVAGNKYVSGKAKFNYG